MELDVSSKVPLLIIGGGDDAHPAIIPAAAAVAIAADIFLMIFVPLLVPLCISVADR